MTEHELLVALRLGVVIAGTLVSLWALRLALLAENHRTTYGILALGFALLTLGAIVEGLLFEFGGRDLFASHTAEALISGAGFVLILVSIWQSRV